MTADKLNRFWLLVTGLLIICIIVSSLIIRARRNNGQPLVIYSPPGPPLQGEIQIEGAIINPGTYPWKTGDTVDEIIQASGGIKENADLSRIHLYIPLTGEDQQAQKININRADIWLLQVLPGIGEVRAQAIIDYRQLNGPFRDITELTEVPGIGESTFEKIKNLITTIE